MRRSILVVGLNSLAVGLVVTGLGTVLAAVAFIGNGSPDLGLVSGVAAAVGTLVEGYALIAIALFAVGGDPPRRGRHAGMRVGLLVGAAGLLAGAVGFLVGALGFVSGDASSALNVASGAIGALSLFVLAHAAGGIGLFGLADRPDEELDRLRSIIRSALFTAAAGLMVGAGGSTVAAVGNANALQAGVVLGGVLAALGLAVVAVAVVSVPVRGLNPVPGGPLWRAQSAFRSGLLVGAVGFLGQAVGTFLSAMSAIGSGHNNLLIGGGVVIGCGSLVVAAALALVAGPGETGEGFRLGRHPGATATPSAPSGVWPGPPS